MQAVTFRLANYETPLWAVPNFNAGRYNRVGSPATQYLSLHPMTPWAEVLRAEDRRTRERALQLRYPLWAVKVDLEDEPVELTFDNAAGHGLGEPSHLIDDDWAECQGLADAFRDEQRRAFVAPSAALPGTRNVVILDAAVVTAYEVQPIGPEDLPTAMAAQDGRCPDELWNLVHFSGAPTPHPEYQAWLNGEEFVFDEPAVAPSSLISS